MQEEFREKPDRWQKKVLKAFASDDPVAQRIAMVACKGPGKTAILAVIIWNFLACYGRKGKHPKGAAVSITQANIDDNLWPELSKWQQRSAFFTETFVWTSTRIYAKAFPRTWFFSKRTWPRSADSNAQSNTLAGLHSEYLLFVLDESGGIPRPVMATAEAGLANAQAKGNWAKIVQAGNPTDLDGPLHDAATRHKKFWTVFHITGDPDDPDRSPRVSVEWARQQIELYGRDNPWVLVNVFGKFPPSSLNALFSRDAVELAMKRHLEEHDYAFHQKRMGIDVARGGAARTVLFPRQGRAAFHPIVRRHNRTDVIASLVIKMKSEWGSEVISIDDTGGWAAGVVDQCLLAGHPLLPINFGGSADDPRYYNKRAEIYFRLKEWIDKEAALPNIPELADELCAMTYTFKSGKFMLEDKQQVIDRVGVSPDLADALALTFALAELPTGEAALPPALRGASYGLKHEWDPFAEI